jgi:putative hydrolase of the HAD superfamily
MIKNIVFDMGNVLARFDAVRFCASRAKDPADAALLRQEVFESVAWAQLDRGVISRDEAAAAACERLPPRLHGDARYLVEHWYDHFQADPEMERFAGKLRSRGYALYLLSNAGLDFYAFRPALKALGYFSGELISAEVHLLKPDRQIFEAFLARFCLRAEECFFVDDMSVNVEAALHLGFSGTVYRGDIRELEIAMEQAGVMG